MTQRRRPRAQWARPWLAGLLSPFLMIAPACSQTTGANGSQTTDAGRISAPAVFVATTPCSAGTTPLPGIPRDAGCEMMKWKLQLFNSPGTQAHGTQSPAHHASGTYILDCDYGMPKQGTRGFTDRGSHLHRAGKWVLTTGTQSKGANPAALLYHLDPDSPRVSVSFLRLNDNLIHLLDSHEQLMIGTGAWSYTLSRVGP